MKWAKNISVAALIIFTLIYVYETFIIILAGSVIFFIPTIIAVARSRHNADLIFAINLFLNWTIIGWLIALILACSNIDTRTKNHPEYKGKRYKDPVMCEYDDLCKQFNEKPQYVKNAKGQMVLDCYGEHAKSLKQQTGSNMAEY
jgi:hypothetical protein